MGNLLIDILFSYSQLALMLLVALVAAGLVSFLWLKKQLTEAKQKREQLRDKLGAEKDLLESEIKRQQYILDDYQKKLFAKKQTTTTDEQLPVHNNGLETDMHMKELALETKKLADEKLKFQEKNKKLWEQSIAIHKEKERIDGLKQEIEHRHKELTDSIRYAKRIQNALLPDEEYVNLLLKEYFILWKPRDIVSGDFYWIKQIRNYTIIVAADCTGHGVPGAFMSMLGIAFLNEVANNIEDVKANEILDKLRELVKLSLKQNLDKRTPADGMDMALCVVDHERNVLQYAGANNPLLLIREGELQQVKATRNPISIYRKEKPFELHTLALQPGDQFYIFSDGYLDQFGGEQGMRFTIKRFKQLLLEAYRLPHAEQKKLFDEALQAWQGDYNQLDDILLIGFKV